MSMYSAYARLQALLTGEAARLSHIRNFPVSDLPLVLIPIQMAGEAPALFALGVGDLAGNLRVYSCPNPTNRDRQYAFLADAAADIQTTLDAWQSDPTLMPQLICQSDAAVTLMLAVIDRMAYVDATIAPSAVIAAVGRPLVFFDKRFERDDSAAVIAATRAAAEFYATGQDPHADTHLGALVEWLKPADGDVLARVRAAEAMPASISTDPALDNLRLDPLVSVFYQAERDGNQAAADDARQQIHGLLAPEVERRYALVRDALEAVIRIPAAERARSIHHADRRAFDGHVAFVAADPRLSRGFAGNAGIIEYLFRDLAHQEHLSEAVSSGGRQRAEARLSGEVLHGQIIDRRESRSGRARIIAYEILTTQERTRIRPGVELALLDNPAGFRFRVEEAERQTAGLMVTLRMVAGMTKGGQPAIGDLVEFGPPQRFARRGQHARDRLRDAGLHPQVSGPGTRGADYLAVIAQLEGGP